MRLEKAIIFVKDLQRMAAFYEQTLGLNPVAETCTGTWVEFEEGVALHAIPPHIADRIEIASPPVAREGTPIKLIFAVPDVAVESARLQALGCLTDLGAREGKGPFQSTHGVNPKSETQ
jgi:catechol 2,3-dioxygenase-like lactoylglutathione lyase family enzyme